MKEISELQQIEELSLNDKLLVKFSAPWCGPCRQLQPIIDSLTDLNIAEVNIDEAQDLAAELNIKSVPTMILFENSKEKSRILGFKTKNEIENFYKGEL